MNPTPDRYARNPDIIETDLADELILLDPSSQEMFSLNETGRLVWRSLPDQGIEGVTDQLIDLFEVSPEQAEADVLDVVEKLADARLIQRADVAGA